MSILQTTIVDDEGRRVPLVPHEVRLRLSGGRAQRLQAAAHLASQPVTRREVFRGIGYGLLALPIMLAAGLAPAFLAFQVKPPWWGMALAVIPLGLLPAAVTVGLARRVAGHRIARVYLGAGYCASCGYDLESTEVESTGLGGNGRRRCPECGACWSGPEAMLEARPNADRPSIPA
jgi:hypothetical protein